MSLHAIDLAVYAKPYSSYFIVFLSMRSFTVFCLVFIIVRAFDCYTSADSSSNLKIEGIDTKDIQGRLGRLAAYKKLHDDSQNFCGVLLFF